MEIVSKLRDGQEIDVTLVNKYELNILLDKLY